MNPEKGLVIIYTGNGKGKTTAALGLVLRSVGYKKRCLIIQFAKSWFSGELASVKKLSPYVKIIQVGKGFVDILGDKVPRKIHKKAAESAFNILYKEITSEKWNIVVADEVMGVIFGRLLSEDKIVKLIANKPANVDLVLTGRNASKKLINLADLVTKMVEVKHPFQKGILAKKGIDF